jgi:general secretion pathway protein C
MQTLAHSIWWPRGASFVLAALAAASASFWVLKVGAVNAATTVSATAGSGPLPIDSEAVTRALGGGPDTAPQVTPAVSLSSRFAMAGVIADLRSGGSALISIDGRPAKPYRVGDVLEDGLILQSVKGRSATLGLAVTGASALTLELPALKQ